MHALRSRPNLQRRFTWLLWLALLLPLAQTAAAWHALSHIGVPTGWAQAAEANPGDAAGKQALHAAHCDLCLTAAAISGAAPLGDAPALPHLAPHHDLLPTRQIGVWQPLLARAYLSRAPPTPKL